RPLDGLCPSPTSPTAPDDVVTMPQSPTSVMLAGGSLMDHAMGVRQYAPHVRALDVEVLFPSREDSRALTRFCVRLSRLRAALARCASLRRFRLTLSWVPRGIVDGEEGFEAWEDVRGRLGDVARVLGGLGALAEVEVDWNMSGEVGKEDGAVEEKQEEKNEGERRRVIKGLMGEAVDGLPLVRRLDATRW
ncbi:hypothetical protein HK101_010810, partial [Irineochytrium annulatum]